MRIDVRVTVPRLRPFVPVDAARLRERLRAVRDMLGGGPLPRTSGLRKVAVEMISAEAERRGDFPESR